jgi:hypothetical protein
MDYTLTELTECAAEAQYWDPSSTWFLEAPPSFRGIMKSLSTWLEGCVHTGRRKSLDWMNLYLKIGLVAERGTKAGLDGFLLFQVKAGAALTHPNLKSWSPQPSKNGSRLGQGFIQTFISRALTQGLQPSTASQRPSGFADRELAQRARDSFWKAHLAPR